MADNDPVETGLYLNKFGFRYITKEDIPRAIEHARLYLFEAWKPLGYDDSMQDDWAKILAQMLESSLGTSFSVIDTETHEIVGLRVINQVVKGQQEPIYEFEHPHNKIFYDYMMTMATKCDVFVRYPNINKYADLYGVSLNSKYRQLGIATETYRRTLHLLKKRGFKVVRCGFISKFSRRAAYKFGCFQVAKEYCTEARTPDGQLINPNADPTEYKEYCIFEL